MKIILLQKVDNLGQKGEMKEVKDGYGLNFLIPQGFAVLPNDPRVKDLLLAKKEISVKKTKEAEEIQELADRINGKKFVFQVKADKNGKIYGSLGPKEIAEKIGVVEKLIKIHYKELGKYELNLELDSAHKVKVQIVVEKEK